MSETDVPLADLPVKTITEDEYKGSRSSTANKSKRATAGPPRKTPLPPWKDGVISSFMTGIYDMAGDLLLPYSEPYGYAFKAIAENCGQAWEDCAKDNPWLRRFIHNLMNASKLSKLAAAHMPLAIVALHQHGPLRQMTDDVADEYTRNAA